MYDFKGIEFVDGDLNDKNSPELLVKTQVEKQDGSLQDVKFRIRRDDGEFEGYRVELVKDNALVNVDRSKGLARVEPYFKNDDLNTFLHIEDKQVLQSDLSSSLLKLFKEYDYLKTDGLKDKNNQAFLKEFGDEIKSSSVINDLERRAKDVDRTFVGVKKDDRLEDAFDYKEKAMDFDGYNYVNQFLNRKESFKVYKDKDDYKELFIDGSIDEWESFKNDKLVGRLYKGSVSLDYEDEGLVDRDAFIYSEKFDRKGVLRKSESRFEAEEMIKNTGSFRYPGIDRIHEDTQNEAYTVLRTMSKIVDENDLKLPQEAQKKISRLLGLYADEDLCGSSLYIKSYEINKNVKDKDGNNVFISGVSARAINEDDDRIAKNNFDLFVSLKNDYETVGELAIYRNDIKEPIYFQKDGIVKNNVLDKHERKAIVRMYQRGQLTDDLGKALKNSGIIRDNEYIRISYPQIKEKNIDLSFAALNERGEYEADNRFTEQMRSYMMRGYGADNVAITADRGNGLSFEPKDWYKKDAMTDPLVLELKKKGEIVSAECTTRYTEFKLGGNLYTTQVIDDVSLSKNGDKILNGFNAYLCNDRGDLICEDHVKASGRDFKDLEFFKKVDIGDDFRKTVNELTNMSVKEFDKMKNDPNRSLPDTYDMPGVDYVEKHANKMGLFYDYIKAVDGVDKLHLSPIYEPTREIFNRANARCESFIKEVAGLDKQVKKSVRKEYGGRD